MASNPIQRGLGSGPTSRLDELPARQAEPRAQAVAEIGGADEEIALADLGAEIGVVILHRGGGEAPDLADPDLLGRFFSAIQALNGDGKLLAYHDRSDGGLFATVCEMAFAGRCGVALNLDLLTIDPHAADWGDYKIRPEQVSVQRDELTLKALFNEELGVVVQVPTAVRNEVMATLREHGLSRHAHFIGKTNDRGVVEVWRDTKCQFSAPLQALHRQWDEVSWRIARQRDNPASVGPWVSSASIPSTGRSRRSSRSSRPDRTKFFRPSRARGASPDRAPSDRRRTPC